MICKNCGERIRTVPRCRSNDVVYDASVKSLVVYLCVVQFLPYGRIANFLHDVLCLSPSEGSLVNWVNEAKRNAQPIVDSNKNKKHKRNYCAPKVVGRRQFRLCVMGD